MERSKTDSGRDIQRGGGKMSLFYNNYQILVQENINAALELSEESLGVLRKMFEYMAAFNISRFQLEVIRKDLIGAAREAETEGIAFKDRIGMPEKEFCDSLVKEGAENTRMERMILALRNMTFALLGLYSAFWVINGAPADYGISAIILFFATGIGLESYFKTQSIQGLGTYFFSDRTRWWLDLGGLIVMSIVIMAISDHIMLHNIFFIRGNGAVILGILFILSAAAFFGNNYYWNKCSEKYNWR